MAEQISQESEMFGFELIIFIKNPVLGKVKTRLAAGLGDEKALEVYNHLLNLTRRAALGSMCGKHLFYSDRIEVGDDWDDDAFNKYVQQGDSLGDRMANAFAQIFALGARKALIIGSDCPQLTQAVINEAYSALDKKDVVIGPAKDGGYYLLGMKQHCPFLFREKEWSTDTVYEDTVIDFMEHRLTYRNLPELSDVDTIYDLDLLKPHFGF